MLDFVLNENIFLYFASIPGLLRKLCSIFSNPDSWRIILTELLRPLLPGPHHPLTVRGTVHPRQRLLNFKDIKPLMSAFL
jgi:hypothetical protein